MCHSVSVSIYFTKIEYHKHTITILFYTCKSTITVVKRMYVPSGTDNTTWRAPRMIRFF